MDRAILKELQSIARQSFEDLVDKSEASAVKVAKRVRKMEKQVIINGYSTMLNYGKLGYWITSVTKVTVSKGKLLDVQNMIARMHSVCAVYDVTGVEDSIVISKFRSRDELSSFTKWCSRFLTLSEPTRTSF